MAKSTNPGYSVGEIFDKYKVKYLIFYSLEAFIIVLANALSIEKPMIFVFSNYIWAKKILKYAIFVSYA